VPTGDRLTIGGKREAVNERRVAATGFVCLFVFAQTAPLLVSYNSIPLHLPSHESRHVASHSLRLAASHGDGHVPRPSSLSSEAQGSHKIPRFPRIWFRFPSFSPQQSPTFGFIRSNIRGVRKMPVDNFLVSWHMLLTCYRWEPGAVRSP
jgi:hypothetical protein